jgi:hypothetical protein
MVQINAYAYDVVIIYRNLRALEETLQKFDNTAQEIRMPNNHNKAKYMTVSHAISVSRQH